MRHFLKKQALKTGTSPGTLIYTGDSKNKTSIIAYDYDSQAFNEKHDPSIEECIEYLKTKQKTWISLCGISEVKPIEQLGTSLNLHPLVLEDIMNPVQRAKLEDYQDYIFIVTRLLFYCHDSGDIEDEQFSMILGKNYLITFLEKNNQHIFNSLFSRIKQPSSRIRNSGMDYLAYALLDAIVDNYFLILERVDDNLNNLEKKLLSLPTTSTLSQIQHMKKEMAPLRKSIWPMREVVNQLTKIESPLISKGTKVYLYDVYDHTVQAIETVEGFRDIISGMLDVYISNINQRMTEVIKVLTVITTIFVPLNFIASFYGMNFKNTPLVNTDYGVFLVMLLMLLIIVSMIIYFRSRKWI